MSVVLGIARAASTPDLVDSGYVETLASPTVPSRLGASKPLGAKATGGENGLRSPRFFKTRKKLTHGKRRYEEWSRSRAASSSSLEGDESQLRGLLDTLLEK